MLITIFIFKILFGQFIINCKTCLSFSVPFLLFDTDKFHCQDSKVQLLVDHVLAFRILLVELIGKVWIWVVLNLPIKNFVLALERKFNYLRCTQNFSPLSLYEFVLKQLSMTLSNAVLLCVFSLKSILSWLACSNRARLLKKEGTLVRISRAVPFLVTFGKK